MPPQLYPLAQALHTHWSMPEQRWSMSSCQPSTIHSMPDAGSTDQVAAAGTMRARAVTIVMTQPNSNALLAAWNNVTGALLPRLSCGRSFRRISERTGPCGLA